MHIRQEPDNFRLETDLAFIDSQNKTVKGESGILGERDLQTMGRESGSLLTAVSSPGLKLGKSPTEQQGAAKSQYNSVYKGSCHACPI